MQAFGFRPFSRGPRRLILRVVPALLAALALASSASAQTTPAHFTVRYLDFPVYECNYDLSPVVCDVVFTGPVRSNLSTTPGTLQANAVLTWEPFEGSPCNTVDETAVFTLDNGTVTTHSVHRDCPATIRPGPRIQTSFSIIGGTGTFAGATGGGYEVAGGGSLNYNGFITF
jgi:hypothetical protein